MDFTKATDQLMKSGLTLPEIGKALGSAATSMRAARLDLDSSSYRTPPPGWCLKLARLARERSAELVRDLLDLADELERAEKIEREEGTG